MRVRPRRLHRNDVQKNVIAEENKKLNKHSFWKVLERGYGMEVNISLNIYADDGKHKII